jgi:WD40-like Beta Propeller Repeat
VNRTGWSQPAGHEPVVDETLKSRFGLSEGGFRLAAVLLFGALLCGLCFVTGVGVEGRAAAAVDTCPNAEFRAGVAEHLTDCRAYELVTPVDSFANVRIGGALASHDGKTFCFHSDEVLLGSDPNGLKTADDGFCAWRGPSGWEAKWVTGPAPPQRVATLGGNVYYLSPDGKRVVFASDAAIFGQEFVFPPGTSAGPAVSAYMWEDGVTTWLAPSGPPVGDPPAYRQEGLKRDPNDAHERGAVNQRRPVAVSEDLTQGVFETDLPLLPSDENEVVDLYEWHPGGLRIVSRDQTGKAVGGRASIQASLQNVAAPGTVSANGERIFFQHDGQLFGGEPEGQDPEFFNAVIQNAYMREGDKLVHISPRRGTGPDASVWIAGASMDGETVFLETIQQITPDAKESGRAIYSYDVSEDALELVATAAGGVHLLGLSDDGSTIVYRHVSTRKLVIERNGVATELGTLHTTDQVQANRVASRRNEERALRITADGSVVVFAAVGQFPDSKVGMVGVYRWEAGGTLQRISSKAGVPQTVSASIGAYAGNVGSPREELFALHRNKPNTGRVISEDGNRVFFETPEALVAEDVNGITDVYEWNGGVHSLVSTGKGTASALYHDSSADGKTVSFVTVERLLPAWDRNSKRDLYVAMPGGGLPPPPPPPAECAGEACQPGTVAPAPLTPLSTAGDGNAKAPLALGAFGRKQLAQLGDKGKAVLELKVEVPGTVTAKLTGRVDGKRLTLAKAKRQVSGPGTLRLPLKLSPKARAELREKGRLRMTLVVAHSASDQPPLKRKLVVRD